MVREMATAAVDKFGPALVAVTLAMVGWWMLEGRHFATDDDVRQIVEREFDPIVYEKLRQNADTLEVNASMLERNYVEAKEDRKVLHELTIAVEKLTLRLDQLASRLPN